MNSKVKIVVLYQVIMHYRLPFYEKIANDERYDMHLLYGKGKKGTKLVNTDISNTNVKAKKLFSIRLPFRMGNSEGTMMFSPFLLFNLICLSPKVVFSEGSSSLINSSIAFIYSKIFRKKFVWWSLGSLKTTNYVGIRKFINKWEYIIEKNSDAIFTYSTQGKNYFVSRGVAPSNIFVGVNVLDTNKKLQEIEESKGVKIGFEFDKYFNLVFIGTITKEKKLELLIDTLSEFNKNNNNASFLHIIGDGIYLPVIKKYAADKKIENFISFYGRINKGASKILKFCDVMVLPGLGGLAICEAMLNSLPIITGNADGTELDLVDSSNGFVISEMNVESLLNKLEYLYKNPQEKLGMGRKSREKITTIYSFDSYYKVFTDSINYVINKNESSDNYIQNR